MTRRKAKGELKSTCCQCIYLKRMRHSLLQDEGIRRAHVSAFPSGQRGLTVVKDNVLGCCVFSIVCVIQSFGTNLFCTEYSIFFFQENNVKVWGIHMIK